ncbi:MAG: ATP-binding protein [Pirellulaceae bacterium]|nr:ATP-binding protein [Pirellulaceae bacterium]
MVDDGPTWVETNSVTWSHLFSPRLRSCRSGSRPSSRRLDVEDFEKLGVFYLGKAYDLAKRQLKDELVLYDSKDLTTHAMCVGMTGSGKTGLCLALLEEAAIDGVPAVIIDPKGDLVNLALTFPELDAASFLPWIDEGEAARQGMTPEQLATATAERWKRGLAEWGQDADRIRRFRDAVEIPIYTPGSNAGLPLTVLRSFEVPPRELLDDVDAYREHVSSTASGLLALLSIEADPVRSREHILISRLLDHAWSEDRDLDVASLIREIQRPPIERVGVVDLETFYPEKDRAALAMGLNSLVASPAFAGWMDGEPLNINRLLHAPEGKPRLSIISIAHLSDAERMFFVTILLNAMVAWMRGQPGTSSLRALLYMDEVFGYFPPTANPPSKQPMLTLLKQARAFGLGVVLATQNPIDLDYRGLSNIGTWFLGRLQTERDKARVLDGLEGAAMQSGTAFDRASMDRMLAALGNRVFLMNNVHENQPLVFQTRWVMSYLRGPVTRGQIRTLVAGAKNMPATAMPTAEAGPAIPATPVRMNQASSAASRPVLPASTEECFASATEAPRPGCARIYRANLLGRVKLHFVQQTYKVDHWETMSFLTTLADQDEGAVWDAATPVQAGALVLGGQPEPGIDFAQWPAALTQAATHASWRKQLAEFCYRERSRNVWKCAELKVYSHCGETEGDFRARLAHLARENRDREIEKLRRHYTSRLATLNGRIQTARERIDREKSEFHKASLDTAVSIGSSILGALFGRKMASATNVRRAGSSMKSAGSAAKQRSDVKRAEEKLADYRQELADLEARFQQDCRKIEEAHRPEAFSLESLSLKPRKSDIQVESLQVVWMPWDVEPSGLAKPAFTGSRP